MRLLAWVRRPVHLVQLAINLQILDLVSVLHVQSEPISRQQVAKSVSIVLLELLLLVQLARYVLPARSVRFPVVALAFATTATWDITCLLRAALSALNAQMAP